MPLSEQSVRAISDLPSLRQTKQVPFMRDIAYVEIFESYKGGFDIVIGNPSCVRQEMIADPSADTMALEREIDQHVHRLYGLTPEEIRIVEDSTRLVQGK